MKWTPGPWRLEDDAIIAANGDYISGGICDAEELDPEIERANALLMAAAPEMFEALKAQHEAIDILFAMLIQRTGNDRWPQFMPSKSGKPWEACLAGNAAIAKATGDDTADPTLWCTSCGSKTREGCKCPPIAENE